MIEEALSSLKSIVGKENLLTTKEEIIPYCLGKQELLENLKVVLTPERTDQIGSVLKILNENRIKTLIVGGGTFFLRDLELPREATAIISTEKLNRIIKFKRGSLSVNVECGVKIGTLNSYLSKFNFNVPIEPFPRFVRTVGGCIAENAYGFRSLRYGRFGSLASNLRLYLPNGELLELSRASVTNNLFNLMIGSLGRFGFLAEASIKVEKMPERREAVALRFRSPETAAKTICDSILLGLSISGAFFIEQSLVSNIGQLKSKIFDSDGFNNILIVEVEGRRGEVSKTLKSMKKIAGDFEEEFKMELNAETALEMAEKMIPILVSAGNPLILISIRVPIDKIPNLISSLAELREKLGATYHLFGYIGDFMQIATFIEQTKPYEEIGLEMETLIDTLGKEVEVLNYSTFRLPLRISPKTLGISKLAEIEGKLKSLFDENLILNVFR